MLGGEQGGFQRWNLRKELVGVHLITREGTQAFKAIFSLFKSLLAC